MRQLFIFLIIITTLHLQIFARSVHRPSNPTIPYITVTASNKEYAEIWKKPTTKPKPFHKFQNKFLRLKILKKPLETSGFKKHLLPYGNLKFRTSEQTVHTNILKNQNELVLKEILQGKRTFTDFTILKDRDFNYKNLSGLIVLKNKKYPFVFKLFIEHPETIVEPLQKGMEAGWIFILSGTMRHLSGFTRISNLENAKKALSKDPEYRYYIDFPRKWYWQPLSKPLLHIDWHDPYNNHFETIKIPSVYGIICDFIEVDKELQQRELSTLRQISMDVTKYLHYMIDPHDDNLVPEKNSHKIVIIDTEHFRTVAGLEQDMHAHDYNQWYFELITRTAKRWLCRSKKKRIQDQCFV
ncbi:hypothetical protein [Candidatus Chromulinivorax destructor]|uniref:Uncharacterized protein n=1 Tax=Candidatus Chromulinivorax destructor TaxID=2066483 RepID=A0A345ZA20_9BACT|nr:hypothetical protein [Candidatus Chromulinivorax destructor]AXK60137.1 hypothetical protein C0J27_00025 [Candidatus Chromulinivorax destructor]